MRADRVKDVLLQFIVYIKIMMNLRKSMGLEGGVN